MLKAHLQRYKARSLVTLFLSAAQDTRSSHRKMMQDRAARLFLYRGDMAPEWAAYGEDAKDICTAFAKGINAAIDLVRNGTQSLPPEFARLGTQPKHWHPEDVVRIRTHCLARNASSELIRAQVHRLAGPEVDLLRMPLSPPVTRDEWHGSDRELPAHALAVYDLATAPVTFQQERLDATLEDAGRWSTVDAKKTVQCSAPPMEGSNNWAIAPSLTETGRPIMASDPHRLHAAPSLRYMVHLSAPGMDLIGAGEPSSPGIMAGHNGTAAFSLTIFCADQEDLIVYETTKDGRAYHYGDSTEEITHVDEMFSVKGYLEQTLKLQFTRHGPIVWQQGTTALAVRTVFTDPGTAPYMASLKTMRTTSMSAFRDALTTSGAPSVNMVYADMAGDICWQAAAYVPQRTGWNGLLPVDGDGADEWSGYLTSADLPAIENPERGFVHSANEMNLPDSWDSKTTPVGFEWFEDGRADRIAEVITAGDARNLAGNCKLQCDSFSAPALCIARRVPDDGSEAANLVRGWDGFARVDSGAALLFEVWLSCHLRPALLARVAPDTELRRLLMPGNIPTIARLLNGEHPSLADRAGLADIADRNAVLSHTLNAAWRDVSDRFSEDHTTWRWGDLHKGFFNHALTPLGQSHDVGPLATRGSSTSVGFAHYDASDFRVSTGASVRMVIDVGGWDNSVWINAPGQSGVPGHPHYDDLAPLWAEGRYVPMPYSVEAVDAATETILLLVPEGNDAAS